MVRNGIEEFWRLRMAKCFLADWWHFTGWVVSAMKGWDGCYHLCAKIKFWGSETYILLLLLLVDRILLSVRKRSILGWKCTWPRPRINHFCRQNMLRQVFLNDIYIYSVLSAISVEKVRKIKNIQYFFFKRNCRKNRIAQSWFFFLDCVFFFYLFRVVPFLRKTSTPTTIAGKYVYLRSLSDVNEIPPVYKDTFVGSFQAKAFVCVEHRCH